MCVVEVEEKDSQIIHLTHLVTGTPAGGLTAPCLMTVRVSSSTPWAGSSSPPQWGWSSPWWSSRRRWCITRGRRKGTLDSSHPGSLLSQGSSKWTRKQFTSITKYLMIYIDIFFFSNNLCKLCQRKHFLSNWPNFIFLTAFLPVMTPCRDSDPDFSLVRAAGWLRVFLRISPPRSLVGWCHDALLWLADYSHAGWRWWFPRIHRDWAAITALNIE